MKSLDDLAIFGKPPLFAQPLHVGRPNIGNRERLLSRINELLDRRWLSNNGPFVQEFERAIEERLGVRHCIAMCNGTVALEIAIRGLGLQGEVIIPSFTFVATAHSLQWQEITPVFCDIDPRTHTLDPDQLERMITPRTTGIIGVHVWGRPCNIDALDHIARKHNLKLMFDASHAFGCSSKGSMIGNFGQAEIFSFHATKFLNSFEGGAIVTNDDELGRKLRLMKNFGFSGYDNVVYIGTNGKMSEISAAMGLTSLESMHDFIEVNRRHYELYRHDLIHLPGIRMAAYDETERCNYQYVVLEIEEELTHIGRDNILAVLHAENVLARRYFYPGCHAMEPYRSYFPHAGLLLPETEALVRRTLILPTSTGIGEAEISNICHLIHLCVRHGKELVKRLQHHAHASSAD